MRRSRVPGNWHWWQRCMRTRIYSMHAIATDISQKRKLPVYRAVIGRSPREDYEKRDET